MRWRAPRGGALSHDGQVERPWVHGETGGIGRSEGLEIADEPGQPCHLPVQRRQRGLVRGHDAVEHRLGIALQDGQRGPQLVGHIGHDVATAPASRLQPICHVIEGRRQLAQLAGSSHIGGRRTDRQRAVPPRLSGR